jgi:hypothetical protein
MIQTSDIMKITVIFTLLFLTCCHSENVITSDFDKIDISIFDGGTDFYCLKVLRDGRTFIFNDRINKYKKYFTVELEKHDLDSISRMAQLILASHLDTLYEANCQDCGAFNLIIRAKDKKFKSLVFGIDEEKVETKSLVNLMNFLYKIAKKSRISIDSVFTFESRTRGFYPPPQPPAPLDSFRRFSPPDSTDKI